MSSSFTTVATVLTVHGIETFELTLRFLLLPYLVATVLTVYGIETHHFGVIKFWIKKVATVLTVHGMRRRVRDSRGAERR